MEPDGETSGPPAHLVLEATDAAAFASLRRPATPRAERYALGRRLRQRAPRSALGRWKPPADRLDPVDLVKATNQGRVTRLVPVRIGRMSASPFAFLRGAAAIMAEDFASLPATGILPVICGDAHLSNFGFYASPERDLVFDLNDFDEAHPGAWEWDLRRLVASVWMAGRQNGSTEAQCGDAVARCVRAYRDHLANLAEQPLLERAYERRRPRPAARRRDRSGDRCTRSSGPRAAPAARPATARCPGSPRAAGRTATAGSSRTRR